MQNFVIVKTSMKPRCLRNVERLPVDYNSNKFDKLLLSGIRKKNFAISKNSFFWWTVF